MNETKKFILLPGNPPVEYYYTLWQDELKILYPKASFTYLTYPVLNDVESHKYFATLIDMLAQKVLQIAQNDKVYLIAHSVGGFFATQLLAKLENKIEKCLLIFPFMGGPTLKGRSILTFAASLEKSSILKQQLFKRKKTLSKLWPELKNVQYSELLASTRLALHENTILKEHLPLTCAEELHSRLHFIYNPKDIWCPPTTIRTLQNSISATFSPLKHDFIVYADQREAMNRLVQNFFR